MEEMNGSELKEPDDEEDEDDDEDDDEEEEEEEDGGWRRVSFVKDEGKRDRRRTRRRGDR